MVESVIRKKSFAFSLEIIELYKRMLSQHEYVISKQLLRSSTSIGANVVEASAGQSRDDFKAKMSIASKEARETQYWLLLLAESKLCTLELAMPLQHVDELIRMLTAIVKTTTENSKLTTQNSLRGAE